MQSAELELAQSVLWQVAGLPVVEVEEFWSICFNLCLLQTWQYRILHSSCDMVAIFSKMQFSWPLSHVDYNFQEHFSSNKWKFIYVRKNKYIHVIESLFCCLEEYGVLDVLQHCCCRNILRCCSSVAVLRFAIITDTLLLEFPKVPLWTNVYIHNKAKASFLYWSHVQVIGILSLLSIEMTYCINYQKEKRRISWREEKSGKSNVRRTK